MGKKKSKAKEVAAEEAVAPEEEAQTSETSAEQEEPEFDLSQLDEAVVDGVASEEPEAAAEEPVEEPAAEEGEAEETQAEPENAEEPEAAQEPTEETPQMTPQEWQASLERQVRPAYEQIVKGLEGELLDDDVRGALTEVATAIHVNLLTQVAQHFTPAVAAAMQEVNTASQAEQAFYDKWPQLRDEKYTETVLRIATAYKQANPSVPTEQAIEEIGAAAMLALRIQPENQGAEETPAPEPAAPYRPAGGRGTAKAAAANSNEFAQLAQEDLDEELV